MLNYYVKYIILNYYDSIKYLFTMDGLYNKIIASEC